MNKRDTFIRDKRTRAKAFRDAATIVPARARTSDGASLRDVFERTARINDTEADDAATMTPEEFRRSGLTS